MIKYILTDIEGTTTSVSFVVDVLFPYFKEKAQDFILENIEDSYIKEQIEEVKLTVLQEEEKKLTTQEVIEKLIYWTNTDRKQANLKALQGMAWRVGYEKGELKGHIYDDVPTFLEKWKNENRQLGVYSSGSVAAQKLLFGTSIFGNLLPFFSNHFDTNIGHKKESQSYENIIKELKMPSQEILFLSDICAELEAAKIAGMQTFQLLREGTSPCENFSQGTDFEFVDKFINQ